MRDSTQGWPKGHPWKGVQKSFRQRREGIRKVPRLLAGARLDGSMSLIAARGFDNGSFYDLLKKE